MCQTVWLFKQGTDEKKRKICRVRQSSRDIIWKQGKTQKLTSLLYKFLLPCLCHFCYFVIKSNGSKNRARITQWTNKKTAQSESLVALYESTVWFSWRHVMMIIMADTQMPFDVTLWTTVPFRPLCLGSAMWFFTETHRCSAYTVYAIWLPHYKNNYFSDYKAMKRWHNNNSSVRLERCMFSL